MTSCDCDCVGQSFDDVYATERLRAYRENGPDPSTKALVAILTQADVKGRTLLDIGGGVGAVQHALIDAGVSSVQEVEASAAHVEACRQEAARRGHGDRIVHLLGDFDSVAQQVRPADIVTLDRSVCCWSDMSGLVGGAASKTEWLLGMVYPRDVWWVRYGWRVFSNSRHLLRRDPMRVFSHRVRDVERVLGQEGLQRRSLSTVGVWQIAVYERR